MSGIPPSDGHELITKGFLRGELAAFELSLTRRVLAMLAAHTVIVSAVWLLT